MGGAGEKGVNKERRLTRLPLVGSTTNVERIKARKGSKEESISIEGKTKKRIHERRYSSLPRWRKPRDGWVRGTEGDKKCLEKPTAGFGGEGSWCGRLF